MNQRTYEIGKKKITIADEKVLELIEKVENLELNPTGTYGKILHLLVEAAPPGASMNKAFEATNLTEEIYRRFDANKATPITERYAEKHNLSGRLTI